MAEKKERFGRYLILDHLVDGGMAKICRARFLGEQADKVVAIKMVQSRFSKDEAFKKMFMSEIKVTFGLLHPNIVQTYDYGLHNKRLFVAMEYCDGRNLKEYLDRLKQKKFVFPVEISIYIISQVCQGLHYAHTYTDKLSGKSANIIHRDISPHNVMLTYDGAVKVIDFGIAKADTNEDETQVGTIKGKISYLAPEYIEGLELDHRYDQFAVGITLWEMLCSRKLFKASNDLAVLKKIQECKIPAPSSVNPNVSRELDEIVLKALHSDRSKRFENMDQLNRSLIKFLYANYPDFNASDLSYFAKELFKEEIKKDREKLFEYGKIDIKPYLEDLRSEQDGVGGSRNSEEVTGSFSDSNKKPTQTKTRKQEQVLDFGFEEGDSTRSNLRSIRDRASRTTRGKKEPTLMDVVAEAEGPLSVDIPDTKAKKVAVPPPPKPDSRMGDGKNRNRSNGIGKRGRGRSTKSEPSTSGSTITRTSIKGKKDSKLKLVALVGVLAVVFLFGDKSALKYLCKAGIVTCKRGPANIRVKEKVEKVSNDEKSDAILDGLEAKGGNIHLIFKNFDKRSMFIYLNGLSRKTDILSRIKIPTSKTQVLRIESPGLKHFVKTVDPTGGKDITVSIPNMPQENFGYLVVARGCRVSGELHFELYGEKRVERMPIRNQLGISFPIKGDDRVPASSNGSAIYTLYYQSPNQSFRKKLLLQFEKVGQRKNLCDLI